MGLSPSEITRVFRFEVSSKSENDPRDAALLANANALGVTGLKRIVCRDLYFIEGNLTADEVEQLGTILLSDPITQQAKWSYADTLVEDPIHEPVIEVALRPGVTDAVAEQIIRAAQMLGIRGVKNASTGQRYILYKTDINGLDTELLARRLLANPVIQRYVIGTIDPVFPHPAASSGQVEVIRVRGLSDDELLGLSQDRRAALDLDEMREIQQYCERENKDLTDIEFEMIAQTWSEHCVHKTFKAFIEVNSAQEGKTTLFVDNLLKSYIRSATEKINAPWVVSAFVDNAGILAFDDQYEVSFKVETHNHPSAIEPFGGANTGVGGVIRDVLGVSAKPIAVTDILCFGALDTPFDQLPEGVLHPRRIFSGVVAGVQDYGNKIGIPTVNGAILFDPGYVSNPLVFCGCVGIAPRGKHRRQAMPGDRIVVLGGGTGRDGLRGATFSSMTMDAQTGEVAGASVQIGDPITEKGLIDVMVEARDLGLYHAITDCGAGGLSSAVGEMASNLGARVELLQVRLKYPGLSPWEIWLSEAQERMVLAVPPEHLPSLAKICDKYDVHLTDIGNFEDTGRLVVCYNNQQVLNLENQFLHEGIPQRKLRAVIEPPASKPKARKFNRSKPDYAEILHRLLRHPNVASKENVVRIYDHEVQGGTIVKPLTGKLDDGPSDACVLKPSCTEGKTALALANGINPEYGKLDAYKMAWSVVDEAVRNLVAVGADPEKIALLDNFCWGDPKRPETLGSLVEAARGCHDAAITYRTPFISGKDSLNNEYLGSDGKRHAIPPTLLISSIGIVLDMERLVTMDFKEPGDIVYLVGDHRPVFGGSYLCQLYPELMMDYALDPPSPAFDAPRLYSQLHKAMMGGWVRACHDLSEGGVAVAASEMCIGGRLGLDLHLKRNDPLLELFGESNGCFLVEVSPSHQYQFESMLADFPIVMMGETRSEMDFRAIQNRQVLFDYPLSALVTAWKSLSIV